MELDERAVTALERIADALEAQNKSMEESRTEGMSAAREMMQALDRSNRRPAVVEVRGVTRPAPTPRCLLCGSEDLDRTTGLCTHCAPDAIATMHGEQSRD